VSQGASGPVLADCYDTCTTTFPTARSVARKLFRSPRLFSIRVRGTIVALTVCAGLACTVEACGSASVTPRPAGSGQLIGRVLVCRAIGERCAPIAATVTVRRVRGKTLGKPVAKGFAVNGRFSFSLPPGKYFPSPSAFRRQFNTGGCISSQAVLHAYTRVRDDVNCFVRQRKWLGVVVAPALGTGEQLSRVRRYRDARR
jgi:hypothetical protein